MKEENNTLQHQYQGGGGGDMADLRQFFSTATPATHNFPTPTHYDVSMMLAMGGPTSSSGLLVNNTTTTQLHGFRSPPPPTGFADVEAGGGGDGGATARWPRQETLTLLEIRSRLHPKFKEANHKGPLWDELSRIMCEEHGYQRSGKKCREKFENLYKYYKKTKDGKSGRHDGKHYRFFRQLEALYGDPPNNITSNITSSTNHHHHMINGNNMISNSTIHIPTTDQGHQCNTMSMSLSNYSSSDFNTSSSEGNKRSWKEKIKEFIDVQMRKIMEKQEAWLEKMVRTIEHKEQQRMCREEEWRRQESQRMEREQKFWAHERAWIEARDKTLMDALHTIVTTTTTTSKEVDDHSEESNAGVDKDCCIKKRKVNCRSKSTNCNFEPSDGLSNINLHKYGEMNSQGGGINMGLAPQEKTLGGGNSMNESCLRMLLGDGGESTHLWDQTYGVNLNKGETH